MLRTRNNDECYNDDEERSRTSWRSGGPRATCEVRGRYRGVLARRWRGAGEECVGRRGAIGCAAGANFSSIAPKERGEMVCVPQKRGTYSAKKQTCAKIGRAHV